MGNRKLRREASEALKSLGFGRLYAPGKKRKIYQWSAHELRRVIFLASLRKGDLVNDCDGFNHRLAEDPKAERIWNGLPEFRQLVFTDGRWSCGCPYGPYKPRTPEQIVQFHNCSDDYIAEQKRLGWWTDRNQVLVDRIRQGLPITDEDGVKLQFLER